MEERLLENNYHRLLPEDLYSRLKTSYNGLTSVQAKAKRAESGLNTIPPPVSAPACLCCILPCLLATPSMEKFQECVPDHAFVRRNGVWIKMDSNSLVPGDIIQVRTNERVPADIRVIEARDCEFDTSAVHIMSGRLVCNPRMAGEAALGSPNMAFLGYLLTAGECTGVVIATGMDTEIAKLILNREWPPKPE